MNNNIPCTCPIQPGHYHLNPVTFQLTQLQPLYKSLAHVSSHEILRGNSWKANVNFQEQYVPPSQPAFPPSPPPHTHKHTHTHTHKENILSSSAANTPNNPHLHSPPAALDISYEGSQNTFKREIVKYVFFSLLNYL